MKGMTTEASATLMIIVLCWILLIIADAAVGGLLKLVFGVPFKKAFLWGLLSLMVPPLAISYGALIERNCFRIKEVSISFENLPEAFDGYRIVHISDIHARSFIGREKNLAKAIDKINRLNPDIAAFTGDLITLAPDELENLAPILGRIKAKTFSVLGNHDYSIYSHASEQERQAHLEDLIARENEMGWKLLLDEHRIISKGTDSIAVIGVQNTSPSRHFPSKGDLKKASEGTEGMFRIVLSHDPMHWENEILGQDYPLTLSGHTHAMQLSILGWSPSSLLFDHHRGLYTRDGQSLYVNPGLGETIFPARIGVRPEIPVITLNRRAGNRQKLARDRS
jgi:predicted MPP superfamily phosphohydrolase